MDDGKDMTVLNASAVPSLLEIQGLLSPNHNLKMLENVDIHGIH